MARIKVNKVKLVSDKIACRLVLISDIHYSSKDDLNKLNKVLEEIKVLNPDYICIAGDICDQAKVSNGDLLIKWLERLALIKPVMMIYGNHDLALYKSQSSYFNKTFFDKVKKLKNVNLLNNEMIVDNNIRFIGLNLGFYHYYKKDEGKVDFINFYNKTVKKLNSKYYNILINHSPIALTKDGVLKKLNDYKNIDLVLCGHMHGGLVPNVLRPIFKNRGLISPGKKYWLVKHAYGHFKIDDVNFIVSSGITKLSDVSKFGYLDKFFSPEIVLIEIEKRNNDKGIK